jgi:hypothetical protein
MFYGYNGDSVDGSGETNAYGPHPPMQAVIILQGPRMDDDGIDNPKYDDLGNQLCDESVNGMFFGDSIVDNERYGMRRFIYFSNLYNSLQYYISDPYFAPEYYNLMKGIWKDGTRMQYGGNGHMNSGAYGPACDFMFPGNSDSLNWGVGCEPPNGPKYWTEITAGNFPDDRRGVSSSGPFTFKPGDKQEIDIAFAWARDYDSAGPTGSLVKLQGVVDKINKAFAENRLPDGTPIYGINNRSREYDLEFRVYPNPAKDIITIEFGLNLQEPLSVRLLNMQGNLIKETTVKSGKKLNLNISGLPEGIYLIQCLSSLSIQTKKIIVLR